MLDEIERVHAYRADVPEPDAATAAAARAVLMDAIGREAASARWTPRTRDRARLDRLQRRRRLVLAGGLATIALGLAGVFGLDTASAPQSALAAQLNQLAKVAASQAWTGIPGPGQYLYTESKGLTESDGGDANKECTIKLVQHREIWTATDGSGALSESGSDAHFTSAADASICASMNMTASSEDVSGGNRYPPGGLGFITNDWKALSTDPSTLLTQVHQRDGGPDTPAELFVNVTDFLRESDVPPAIRGALYQALALIPGVRLLGPQTDSVGQSGLGVGFYKDGRIYTQLIFDQQTGRLLYEAYYDSAGSVADWTAYIDQKIVDTLPNYPMEQTSQANPSGASTTSTGASTTSTSTPAAAGTTTTSG
jgi:RNA polymerase sigma-70 factor (ECF subfamily)